MATNELFSALECLIAGRASPDDLKLLRQALAEGRATLASEGGVAIGGDVSHSVILAITGDNIAATLTKDVLKQLIPTVPYQARSLSIDIDADARNYITSTQRPTFAP